MAARNKLPEDDKLVVARGATQPVPVAVMIEKNGLIAGALPVKQHENHMEKVIGTLEGERPPALWGALRAYARLRKLQGSSVAAAMTVFLPSQGLDAYADIVNRTSVVLMAAAARATGGELYAIPLVNSPRHHVAPNTPVRRSDIFVPSKDVFLVATGITDNLILKGVRFPEPGYATTETICLRSGTGSVRHITQDHDLKHKTFRMLKGSEEHTDKAYDRDEYCEVGYDELLRTLI